MKTYVTILFSTFFLQTTLSYAESLLVPDATMDFASYQSHCKKEGYLCTGSYFLDEAQKSASPQLETLINEIDYASETFKAQLIPRLYTILKEESISLEQVDIILGVIEQAKEISNPVQSKQLLQIEKYLKELVLLIKENELTEVSEEYLVIFKKALPLDFMKKLKMQNFKIHMAKISFNKIPKEINFFSKTKTADQFVVQGQCEKAVVHPIVTIKNWQIDSQQSCGFSEQISKATNSSVNFVKENKTSLATTALIAIGVGVFLNNYEVKFTF